MDVEEYDHVLMIGFSTPAVDQDNQPTFGAMVSCISMCIRLLSKVKWTLAANFYDCESAFIAQKKIIMNI